MGSSNDTGASGLPKGSDPRIIARIKDLEQTVGRMRLINQALWEVLRVHFSLSDAELRDKMHEVDLRDGVEDGRLGDTGIECPSCNRVSNPRHGKCLYCDEPLERQEIF